MDAEYLPGYDQGIVAFQPLSFPPILDHYPD